MRHTKTAPTTALALCLLALGVGAADAFAAAPTIEQVSVADATTEAITLQAEINPQGKASSYHFEYGPADCSANPCMSIPAPKEGTIKAGAEAVEVSARIEGLTPGATYHLRVLTHNSEGEAKSPDRTFAPFDLPQSFAACPNDALRQGPGAKLPDCRAYEQATPLEKNGGDASSTVSYLGASINGGAVPYISDAGFPGGEGSQELPLYLASRSATGWTSQGLLPPASAGQQASVIGWLPDYSQVYDTATLVGEPTVGEPYAKTFLQRTSAGGALATIAPYGVEAEYLYAGASADGSTVLFETGARGNTSPPEGTSRVYTWERDSGDRKSTRLNSSHQI